MYRHLRTCTCVAFLVAMLLGQTANLAAAEPTTKKFALLVGVKDYESDKLKALKYTENDVSEMATVLRAAGYEVVLLTSTDGKKDANAKPTRANIEKQLTALLAKCKKGDTIMVAMAGHGLQFEDVADSFFCPEDAAPFADEKSRATLLSLKGVYDKMEKSPGAVKLLLVDACRNDPSSGRSVDSKGAGQPPAGVAALFSCSSGERAYELDNYRHGLFFYHVLEGLRGKAKNGDDEVTWDSLNAYVRKKVPEDAPKLLNGMQQTPSLNAGELRGEPPILIGRLVKLAARAKLLVSFSPLDRSSAERWQMPQKMQPQVYFVVPGGAGDQLGLQRGDVIRRVNGRDVETVPQVIAAIRDLSLGERVELDVLREKQPLKLTGRYQTSISEEEEIRRVRELAGKEDGPAMHYLGAAYENGIGVAKDTAEAAKWFHKSAELLQANSQFSLGWMYAHGNGVTKDDAEALKWFRKAADQGHPTAQNWVGVCYANARGVTKDETEAVKWYRKAAEQGESFAQNNLGIMLSNGRGLAKDDAEAMKWYRKAAEQGNADAQNNCGFMFDMGRGVAKDNAEAAKWYRKAAEAGHAYAQHNIGHMYADGRGVTKDDGEAVKWYRKSADQGNSLGQNQLGLMYQDGRGIGKDEAEAAKWYRKAADQGNAQSQYNLGLLYAHGEGVTKDDGEAMKWLRKSADQGHASAQNWVGFLYASGRGVTRDDAEAIKWYRKAIEKGESYAENNLGTMYENGTGVAKDMAEAMKWYRKAADQGNAFGQLNLGRCYAYGKGVAKNEAEAAKWFRKAAAQGNEEASKELKRLTTAA